MNDLDKPIPKFISRLKKNFFIITTLKYFFETFLNLNEIIVNFFKNSQLIFVTSVTFLLLEY